MTMIRINLIAEKKTGPVKATKKTAARPPSPLMENLIIVVAFILAFGLGYLLHYQVKTELEKNLAEKAELQAKYDKLKHWEAKRDELLIHKELLNEKIEKISELKDNREGPVKLMEDVANVMPESIWLSSIRQGYAAQLVKPTGKGRKAYKPEGQNIGDVKLIAITGYARTTDAITNFARQIRSLDKRYLQTDLNNYDRKGPNGQYEFQLFFKLRSSKEPAQAQESE